MREALKPASFALDFSYISTALVLLLMAAGMAPMNAFAIDPMGLTEQELEQLKKSGRPLVRPSMPTMIPLNQPKIPVKVEPLAPLKRDHNRVPGLTTLRREASKGENFSSRGLQPRAVKNPRTQRLPGADTLKRAASSAPAVTNTNAAKPSQPSSSPQGRGSAKPAVTKVQVPGDDRFASTSRKQGTASTSAATVATAKVQSPTSAASSQQLKKQLNNMLTPGAPKPAIVTRSRAGAQAATGVAPRVVNKGAAVIPGSATAARRPTTNIRTPSAAASALAQPGGSPRKPRGP